jgi:hypothetical protein
VCGAGIGLIEAVDAYLGMKGRFTSDGCCESLSYFSPTGVEICRLRVHHRHDQGWEINDFTTGKIIPSIRELPDEDRGQKAD